MVLRAQEIEGVAADWLIRRDNPDWSPADEFELQVWLDKSDAHKVAYWRLECGWRAADRIAALGAAAVYVQRPRSWMRVNWRSLAMAASIAGILVVPMTMRLDWLHSFTRTAPMRYETVLGGRRQVVLEDGSTIELNTSTVIRTAVSGVTRDVWLDRGEAFFSINHESAPFVVHAGSRLITDLGTRFLVRREGESVRVAVTDGRVRVTEANTTDPSPTATIQKGDMLEAEGDSTLVIQNTGATIARTLAWRSGMLEFDRTPLLRAAQEFNRYNQHKLSVTGKAAEIPIGGSFRVSNIQGFARLLHDAYGLRIDETAAETKISG